MKGPVLGPQYPICYAQVRERTLWREQAAESAPWRFGQKSVLWCGDAEAAAWGTGPDGSWIGWKQRSGPVLHWKSVAARGARRKAPGAAGWPSARIVLGRPLVTNPGP